MSNLSKRNDFLLAAALVVGAGAEGRGKVMEDNVAMVNGTPIMLTEFKKEFNANVEGVSRRMPGYLSDPSRVKEVREKTLEQLIAQELFYQEGVKLKVKVRDRDVDAGIEEIKGRFAADESGKALPPAQAEEQFAKQLKMEGLNYSQFRERITRQVMINKVLDQEVKEKLKEPPEKAVREYFDRVKNFIVSGATEPPKGLEEEDEGDFMRMAQIVRANSSERLRLSRILVRFSPGATDKEKKRALASAKDLKKRLDDGKETFAELARAESEDAMTAARGGDMGNPLIRGLAPPEFEKAAFSLPVGEVSEPIETEMGYFIIRVQEKRAAESPDFENFKEDLGQFLKEFSYHKEMAKFLKGLKAKAVIERTPSLE